jgi:hypothetical protein
VTDVAEFGGAGRVDQFLAGGDDAHHRAAFGI